LAGALAVLAACAPPESVPALFVPDAVDLQWDDAWNQDDDGLVLLVPVDVMAYDAATGGPLGALSVSLGDVHDDETDVETLGADEVVWWNPSDGEAPADSWWDARRDAFFDLSGRASDEVSSTAVTNAEGVARFYLLVDVLPIDSDRVAVHAGFGLASLGSETDETFLLQLR
jgi:hypothetical protein